MAPRSLAEFRGLAAGLSPDMLGRRCREAPYADLLARIVQRVKDITVLDAASDDYIGPSAVGWYSVTPGVIEAAAVWRLQGDPAALAHVERCIGHLAEIYEGPAESRAHIPAHLRRPALSHGEIALAADFCRGDLKPEALTVLNRLMRDHIVPSADFRPSLLGHSAGSNIPCTRNVNAGIAALVWGEEAGCAGAEAIIDGARDTCIQYLHHACDAEGFGYEGSGYVQDTIGFIMLFAHLLHRNGRENLFASEPRLRRVAEANLHLLLPDRRGLINIGDCGIASPVSMGWLLWPAREYSDPVLLGLWQELDGPDVSARRPLPSHHSAASYFQTRHLLMSFLFWDAHAPCTPLANAGLPTAIYSPGTEISAFRTSWSRDAVYVNLLGSGRSHTALTHCHQESGHVSLFAYGDYLAIDTGRYNGGADQHSVMLVDQPDQDAGHWGSDCKGGRIGVFQHRGWLDYALVEAAHQRECLWADRHLLFVRAEGDDAYIVIIDNVNKDNAKHTFWWQLHAHPESDVQVTGPRTAQVRGTHARLDITFAIPGPDVFPQDPHTIKLRVDEKWWSWPDGKGEDVKGREKDISSTSIRRPRLLAAVTGLNGLLATVLVPRRQAEAPLPIRVAAEAGVMRLDIACGPYADTILVALDHGFIRLPGISGFSRIACIRRPLKAGSVDCWTVDGAPLRIDDGA